MQRSARELDALLDDLPVADRLSMLLVSIIRKNPSAVAVSFSVLNALVLMSRGLSLEHRVRVAEAMRDRADMLEHGREVAGIV